LSKLYLLLNIGSILFPIVASFHPKSGLARHWKAYWGGIAISAVVFLVWDAVFTQHGVWGFNDQYLLGPRFWGMPLEEWMFFFCIPYASLFIHFLGVKYYGDRWQFPRKITYMIYSLMTLWAVFQIIAFAPRWYTTVNAVFFLLILFLGYIFHPKALHQFLPSFLIIMIPFITINGILTGSGLEEPVVWYNNAQNMSLRLGTIPLEDFSYAFSMLFLSWMGFERISAGKPI